MVMSVRGDPDAAYRQAGFKGGARQDAEERAARQARETGKDDEGVVDTEAGLLDVKGEPPPGKSSQERFDERARARRATRAANDGTMMTRALVTRPFIRGV